MMTNLVKPCDFGERGGFNFFRFIGVLRSHVSANIFSSTTDDYSLV